MKMESLSRKASWIIALAWILLVISQQYALKIERENNAALSKEIFRLQALAFPAVASFRQAFGKEVQP